MRKHAKLLIMTVDLTVLLMQLLSHLWAEANGGPKRDGNRNSARVKLVEFGGRCLLQATFSPGGTNCTVTLKINSSSFITMLHQNVQTIKSVFF